MGTGRRRSAIGALGALALLLAGGSAAFVVPAGAETPDPSQSRNLVATASAQGMRMTYGIPDLFVVTTFIDGGGPVAQVNLDTTGKAIGFGSLPYPGENAVNAPGAITLASGFPFPAYPFYAQADHPTQPKSEVKDPFGGYQLTATAAAGRADGLAAVNFAGPTNASRIVSEASGRLDASGATVSASSVSQGLNFGDGMLRIASVTSRSVSTYAPGAAKPDTRGELVIDGAKVGEVAVTIGPDGVHPLGQSVPFPGGGDALNQALGQAGISVRTLSLQSPEGGSRSDALQVTLKHPVPGATVSGTLVYEIGGSSSSILFGAEGPTLPALPVASASPPPPAVTPDVPAQAVTAPALPPPSLSVPLSGSRRVSAPSLASRPVPSFTPPDMGGVPAEVTPSVPAEAELSAAPAPPPQVLASQPAATVRADLKKPARVLMAMLAAAGALALAASTLLRTAL